MAARELDERPVQFLGQGLGAMAGEPSALGAVASGGNDALRDSVQGGQVQLVATDSGGVMGEEEAEVGDPLWSGPGNDDVGLPVVEADAGKGDELSHGFGDPLTPVEVFDLFLFPRGLAALGLSEQSGRWWLVGDEEPNPFRVAADDVQSEQGTEAGAEHIRRFIGHGLKKA